MIDLRYHIYSIAAVFLALAMGIIIGTSMISKNSTDKSARNTIRRYEANMNKLKDEITLASAEASNQSAIADKYRSFCKVLLPQVVSGKLEGKNIAIVQISDDDDLMGQVRQALQQAGAKITSTTKMNIEFNLENTREISSILVSIGMEPSVVDDKILVEKLFGILAENLSNGMLAEALPKLSTAGFATVVGDYYAKNNVIIIIGGNSKVDDDAKVSLILSNLLEQLEKRNITIVGCEASNANLSYIPFWKKYGIATVDDADTAIGQMSLVFAAGGEVANFGIKDTADRFVPQSLENE